MRCDSEGMWLMNFHHLIPSFSPYLLKMSQVYKQYVLGNNMEVQCFK